MDAGGAGGGHEVGIVGPSRNHMDVEMFGHARSGGASQIEAKVKAIGLEGFF